MSSLRKKILLSDDLSLLLGVRESLLQTSQVSPLIASNSTEVMALARTWKPDLLILGPKEVVGIAQALKDSKDFRDIPLIAVLDAHGDAERERALEAGCDDWLAGPVDEMELLNKVQDFVGLRFRKLPRYTHNAPALVTFKGKDFPCQSVDINRRMIFVETSEGLAPATDRNVRLQFQLTKQEPVTCWGRVVKLMARKGPHDEKEIIGMLIRFLDLPAATQKRIDALALKQYDNARLPEAPGPDASWTWHDTGFYRSALPQLASNSFGDLESKLSVPPAVFGAYLSALSTEEKEALRPGGDAALANTVAVRVQLMDEISKYRDGAPLDRLQTSLTMANEAVTQQQQKLDQAIQSNDEAAIQRWAGIKTETLRNKVELESMARRQSPFARTLESRDDKVGGGTARRGVSWLTAALILALGVMFYSNLQLRRGTTDTYHAIEVGQLGAEGNYLVRAHLVKPGPGNWTVFVGNLGAAWANLSPDQRTEYMQALKTKLEARGVKQVLLLEPDGRVNSAVINDEIQTLR